MPCSTRSLGPKKSYTGTDLLAALQKKVFINQLGKDAAADVITDLVLYDPEEHKPATTAAKTAGEGQSDATGQYTEAGTAAGEVVMPGPAAPADKACKVYADPFLVEKLRPHQRDGLK